MCWCVSSALHLLCALGDIEIDSCGNFFLLISDHLAIVKAPTRSGVTVHTEETEEKPDFHKERPSAGIFKPQKVTIRTSVCESHLQVVSKELKS